MGCNNVFKRLVGCPRQHYLRLKTSSPVTRHFTTVCISSQSGRYLLWDIQNLKCLLCNYTTFPTSTCCRVRFARTTMFPHGRPAHILGPAAPRPPTGEQPSAQALDSDSVSSSDDHDMQEAGSRVSADSENSDSDFAPSPRSRQKRRKLPSGGSTKVINNRIPVPWIDYGVVRGWAAVLAIFKVFSEQCDRLPS